MSLKNDFSKHRLFVQRLVGTEAANIKTYLTSLKEQANRALAAGLTGKTLQQDLRNVMKSLPDTAIANMIDIAEYEMKFSARTLSKYIDEKVAVPIVTTVEKALTTENIAINNVLLKGRTVLDVDNGARRKSLATAYKQFGTKKADEIAQVISDGIVNKLGKAEISAAIAEKISGLQSAQARSLASVAVNYSTNIAKSQIIDENRDIIQLEQWSRDIEADSCSECESLDGDIEEAGTFAPPPIHWGCRCEVIPYVE